MKVQYMLDLIQPCNAQLTVFFDAEQLRKFMERYDCEGFSDEILEDLKHRGTNTIGSFWHSESITFVYVMLLPPEYSEHTIWHEALHCATRMWEQAGAELDFCKNDEVLTYTQNHIVKVLQKMYKRKEELSNGY